MIGAFGARMRMWKRVIIIAVLFALGGLMIAYWATIPKAKGALKWTKVNQNGFGQQDDAVYCLATYNGKLYAGTSYYAAVWRYDSGTSWSRVNQLGFGDGGNSGALCMQVFGTKLYVGTQNVITGAEVWAYDGSTWTQVNTDGFGEIPKIDECPVLAVYNNELYAITPLQVYKYISGTTWNKVNTPWDAYNHGISAISYDGYLWVGTQNTTTGTEIWRYDGATWQQMNTDGFGQSKHYYTYDFVVYNNQLYAVGSLGDVMKYNGGTSWSDIFNLSTEYIYSAEILNSKLYIGTSWYGCHVYSYNGSSWTLENEPGFGDANNQEASAMAVFNNKLYVGTVGATAQVWMTDGSPYVPPSPYYLYLAEGSTDWGFSCYITIENPNSQAVQVKVTYQTSGGEIAGPSLTMPALSQATINPAETLGSADFSTKIECTSGLPIAADRTMIWNSGSGEEGHSAVAVTSPAKTWYLPEGSSKWGFECFLLIQNPNSSPAHVTITYMTQDQGAIPVSVEVPASSRRTYNMKDHIGEADSSIKVTSDIPVIPERAMYRNSRREGHDSIGTTLPASDYYLAEGAVGWDVGFETWVLVQNPNDKETEVSLTFMTQTGEVEGPNFKMAPNSRQSLKLNNYLPLNTDVSTHVHGSNPIIAERAMYWTSSGQEVCHDSIGMDSAHTTFYLPDGWTDNGRETWTLVQNPNSTSVEVEISYLTPTGEGNVTKTETIPANSRKTFNMLSHSGISGRAAILVRCKTSGKKIMVERAMYWNSRGAGTDTIGGYSD